MRNIDWTELSRQENAQQRLELTDEDFKEAIKAESTRIREAIERTRQILLVQGLASTDIYLQMAKGNAFTKEETLINPRVRIDPRYGTPSFYWEKTVRHAFSLGANATPKKPSRTRTYDAWVRRKGSKQKEKMHVALLSEHVPINKKTLSVSLSVFAKEPNWVQLAARLLEPKLTRLRVLAKTLSALSRLLFHFQSLIDKDTNEANKP